MRAFGILAGTMLLTLSAPLAAQQSDAHDFVEAVRKGDGDKVTQLLDKRPLGLLDSRADNGDTPLTIAVSRRDEDWTGFLLGRGADPNIAGRDGETPLIAAARVGFDQGIVWLLNQHAKVDADNKAGETALIVAVQQNRLAAARLLLDAGADPDKTDYAGYSARDYAKRDPRGRDIARLIDSKKPAKAS